ncbi:methyltransferase domain-containing protein [Glycomyces sp. L485]|uniref:class I SAM-dependent methyltransferase n=1 Tax=Glycomyces sp. L485 TaxID=2909235 RepID=UPI001F4A0D69|nr:class I SAM-dependent methyltransferase [Glycomyces sp. L485]MCH7232277.1 methyltransferase domain-containing protein [Glycomyces sp. L485]
MIESRGKTTEERYQSGENYTGAGNLKTRQSLYAYKTPRYDLPAIVADRIGGEPERVLDIGCGNGNYTRHLRERFPVAQVVGVDLAPGIMADLAEPTIVADVADLPFDTGSADVVLAMHMLYHVPDIPAALDELGRVLTSGGVLFVSTVADDDKPEFAEVWREAAAEALGIDVGDNRAAVLDRFSLASAEAMLAERYASVRLHDLPGVIDLPEPGPLVDFYRSMRSFVELDEAEFEAVLISVESRLMRYFETRDTFRITSHPGILECRDPRC